MSGYTEDSLVEQPAIALFAELGWETANCFYETFGPKGTLGRETPYDVYWIPGCGRLSGIFSRFALTYILSQRERRSGVAGGAINVAVEELTKQGLQGRKQG